MNKSKKIFKIILIAILILVLNSCICYADAEVQDPIDGGPADVVESTEDSSSTSTGGGSVGLPSLSGVPKPSVQSGKATTMAGNVLGAIIAVGCVLITVFIGLTGFGMILGSAEEKAVAKEKLTGYLVAVIILTGGAAIAKIIISIAESFG